jgi:preprotein translocase subunit SecA
MDYLQEGIGLRAMAQRDPLVEYQREGYDMFNAMLDGIKEESVGYLFNLEVEVEDQPEAPTVGAAPVSVAKSAPTADAEEEGAVAVDVEEADEAPAIKAKGLEKPSRPKKLEYSAPTVDGEGGVELHSEETADEYAGVNRNDPCPCGSGKKFKRCHGDPRNRNK